MDPPAREESSPEAAPATIAARLAAPGESAPASARDRELRRAMKWVTAHVRTPGQLRRAERNVALHRFMTEEPSQAGAAAADRNTLHEEIGQLAGELSRLESRRRYLAQQVDARAAESALARAFNTRLSDVDYRLRTPVRQLAHYANTLRPEPSTDNPARSASPSWQEAHTVDELLKCIDAQSRQAGEGMAVNGPEGDFDVVAMEGDASAPKLDAEDLVQWLLRASNRDMQALREFQSQEMDQRAREKDIDKLVQRIRNNVAKCTAAAESSDAPRMRNVLSEHLHLLRCHHNDSSSGGGHLQRNGTGARRSRLFPQTAPRKIISIVWARPRLTCSCARGSRPGAARS